MEERHGWVLATFLQRLAAYAIDTVLFKLPLLILALALFFALFFAVGIEVEETGRDGTVIVGKDDSEAWETGGLLAVIIVALGSLAVSAGYVVWWLFTLRHGQTPGKQLVGIRVIKSEWRAVGLGLHVPAGVCDQRAGRRISLGHDRGYLLG